MEILCGGKWHQPSGQFCKRTAKSAHRGCHFKNNLMYWVERLMLAGFCCLFMIGCGSAEIVSPEIAEQASGLTAFGQKIETKQDAILSAVKQNDTSIKAVWAKLEALDLTLSTLKPQTGKDGDPKISPPESPAKANTQQPPVQVATPGTSQSETLVELASRLYARGVNVHNRTEDELKAIDAQMQGVKSSPVQYQSRPTYLQPSGTVCINGQCFTPKTVSKKGRR